MQKKTYPADAVCVCQADGGLRPIRLRVEAAPCQYQMIRILKVLKEERITYPGAEARIYSCEAAVGDKEVCVEIRFSVRNQTWYILNWAV